MFIIMSFPDLCEGQACLRPCFGRPGDVRVRRVAVPAVVDRGM